jgi:hypothetical protein
MGDRRDRTLEVDTLRIVTKVDLQSSPQRQAVNVLGQNCLEKKSSADRVVGRHGSIQRFEVVWSVDVGQELI